MSQVTERPRYIEPQPRVAPGPKGAPLLGLIPEVRRKGLLDFFSDAARNYGNVVRLPLGPITQYLLAHPDHIKHALVDNVQNYCKGRGYQQIGLILGQGLFTSEGKYWQQQRRRLQPPFTAKAVYQFSDDIVQATDGLRQRWEQHAERGAVLDIHNAMMQLAMSIIGRTMLSVDVGDESQPVSAAFTNALQFISKRSSGTPAMPLSVPTPANQRFKRSLQTVDDFVQGVLNERERGGAQNDLLNIMLKARENESDTGMTAQQLRDEIITFFFAGHETTAQALTWTWYLLSQHPEAEARLHAEVDLVLGDRLPTQADLHNLPYSRMVVEEAMRLYPPVFVFVRDALNDDEIGGYHIPRGSMLVFSQWVTHRSPQFWDRPEVFEPERFTPERVDARPRYAYFPFGVGPRTCIGNHFALLEAQTIVAMIAQRYRLRLAAGQRVEPEPMGTLRPRYGMRMTLERR